MPDLSKRAKRIVAAGKALAGDRWQTALANTSGVKQQLLAMIASGERQPTDDVYRKIAESLLRESDRQRLTADKIDELAGKMLRELEE